MVSDITNKLNLNPALDQVEVVNNNGEIRVVVTPDFDYLQRKLQIKSKVLPSDKNVYYVSDSEPDYFIKDIFIGDKGFKKHIELNEDSVIFDLGANVGYFSFYIDSLLNNYQIYAFEPSPPTFDVLCLNVLKNDLKVNCFPYGISNENKQCKFTYYPNSSAFSTFYSDTEQEKDLLKGVILEEIGEVGADLDCLSDDLDVLVSARFERQEFVCQTFTLSEIVAEQGVSRIDLLKIDVEKSELDVLTGIEPEHWGLIRQVVVEVHDINGQLQKIDNLLTSKEFETTCEKMYGDFDQTMFTLFAKNRYFRPFPSKGKAHNHAQVPVPLQCLQDQELLAEVNRSNLKLEVKSQL